MSGRSYDKLLGKEHEGEALSDPDSLDDSERLTSPRWSTTSRWFQPLKLALAASVVLNVYFVGSTLWSERTPTVRPDISNYGGLLRDSFIAFEPYSKYGVGNTNETDRSLMWESIPVSVGSVAIDHEWAREKGLPEAQNFPWDDAKGIYLLNGHHSLHCLRKVRRWVTIAYHNGTQLDSYAHVVHCMSTLLDNILCEADDTPLYTTSGAKKDAGYRQTRQCRSWDALNQWAETQTACYGFINETQGVYNRIERYKWCPETTVGNVYQDRMREALGLPGDWREERPLGLDSLYPYWEQFTNNVFDWDELTAQ